MEARRIVTSLLTIAVGLNEPTMISAAHTHVREHACAKLRVLHVINGRFFGGGHRSTLNLIAAQRAIENLRAALCTLGESNDSPVCSVSEASIEYNGKYNHPVVLWRASRRLHQLIQQRKVEVLHTHGLDADLIGGLAVRGASAVHICHLRISPPIDKRESWKADLRKRLYRYLALKNGTWFIAVSEAVRRQMAEYYRLPLDRIVTVLNGIDLSSFPEPAPSRGVNGSDTNRPLVIGTAARLAPMKGLEHLIDAAAVLRQAGIHFEVRIAGGGSLLDALQQQSVRQGVADRVKFVGHIDDMSAFYRELDLFVLPSVSTEGLPLTVLEAMASGLPVVATDVGGTAEALRDGVDGFVIPPGDVPALVDAIRRLESDPELRKRMGASGRDRVVFEFSRERVAREVAQVYQRVLEERRRVNARR